MEKRKREQYNMVLDDIRDDGNKPIEEIKQKIIKSKKFVKKSFPFR